MVYDMDVILGNRIPNGIGVSAIGSAFDGFVCGPPTTALKICCTNDRENRF